jgi:hypothetical protein
LAPRHPPNALIALNTYHQCPHAGPNPTTQSSAYQTNRLSFTHSLFCSRHHRVTQSSRPTHTASLVTNQSDSPVKHHASRFRSLRTHHQAANPLCSGTSSSKEHPSGHSTHQTKPLETVGIEPTAPCLQSRCSTTELRPHNPETKQPIHQAKPSRPITHPGRAARSMVGQGGLEPPTPRLSSVCSNQLSYWPQSSQTHQKDPTKGPLQAGLSPKAGAPRPGSSQPVNTCISLQIPEPGYAVSAQASFRSPPASPQHPAQRHDVFS